MSNPYQQALGSTLIDRTVRERIVLVGVIFDGHDELEVDESLDELSRLIDTAGADEVGRLRNAAMRRTLRITSVKAKRTN